MPSTPDPQLPERARVQAARVLIVGDSMLDRYWFGAVDRISPEAPVPVVRVVREEHRAGGAANVALNARALGAAVSLLGLAGRDEPARVLRGLLESAGVPWQLREQADRPTTVKLRVIGRAQQLLRADFEQPPADAQLAGLQADFAAALDTQDAVIFSDYGKGALAGVAALIERAAARRCPSFVDPKGTDWRPYRGATVVTPNRAELQAVVGAWASEADLERRAHALRHELGLGALLLTRSEEGMTLFDDDGSAHVAAQAREVFDVTGAGDTVIAVLATLVAAGLALRQALPLANRAGGIVVGRFGTASVSWDDLAAAGAA